MSEEYVVVGKFGKVHGIKGFIKLISFTDPLQNIFEYLPWYCDAKILKFLEIKNLPSGFAVLLEDFADRDSVQTLTNQEVSVLKSSLPKLKPDEYYWSQLQDLEVENTSGKKLGKVVEIFDTGANDVLIVKGQKKILIPYVKDKIIKNIDLELRKIIVAWEDV